MKATYELRKTMIFFNGLVLNKEIHIGENYKKFDKDLKITDEATQKAIKNQMTAFADWIKFCYKGSTL